ncbi:hypothetical protein UJY56_16115, partial [Klebsiella pneumoniae]|uniref:hypothetical protein n=1 Tax=Klebsiella pneumoniae TaxID=573 RepID=UPI002ACACD92
LMMSLWDALRMNMMISYQELVRTFPERFSISVVMRSEDEKIQQRNGIFRGDDDAFSGSGTGC